MRAVRVDVRKKAGKSGKSGKSRPALLGLRTAPLTQCELKQLCKRKIQQLNTLITNHSFKKKIIEIYKVLFNTKPCFNILPRAISYHQQQAANINFATQKLNQFTKIESFTQRASVYL